MANVPNYDEYISVAEAADLYGVARSFFYDAINRGAEQGGIRGFDVPGKRGLHMLRVELTQFMQPKPVQPKEEVG